MSSLHFIFYCCWSVCRSLLFRGRVFAAMVNHWMLKCWSLSIRLTSQGCRWRSSFQAKPHADCLCVRCSPVACHERTMGGLRETRFAGAAKTVTPSIFYVIVFGTRFAWFTTLEVVQPRSYSRLISVCQRCSQKLTLHVVMTYARMSHILTQQSAIFYHQLVEPPLCCYSIYAVLLKARNCCGVQPTTEVG